MAVTSMQGHASITRPPFRMSIETAGLFTLLLAAWGGIVSYVGPTFGFSADNSGVWTWSEAHTLLFLLPGGVAFLGGIAIMVEALSIGPARKMVLGAASSLTAICGAWFIVGPIAWPALKGAAFFSGASALHELAYWIGYSLGPGALLLALGAFVLGRPRAGAISGDFALVIDEPDTDEPQT